MPAEPESPLTLSAILLPTRRAECTILRVMPRKLKFLIGGNAAGENPSYELVNVHGGAAAEFPTDVQDLLIRARAQRDAFGPAIPIIDGLVRERGLFPYLEGAQLGIADQLALEMHRPVDFAGDTVFHRAQARVYHLLLKGENVALSAPTSFGKSLIVDAVIAEECHMARRRKAY